MAATQQLEPTKCCTQLRIWLSDTNIIERDIRNSLLKSMDVLEATNVKPYSHEKKTKKTLISLLFTNLGPHQSRQILLGKYHISPREMRTKQK